MSWANMCSRAGDAVGAYLLLRAFSWQLRLSPVALEEFAAALFAPHPPPLMDEARALLACCWVSCAGACLLTQRASAASLPAGIRRCALSWCFQSETGVAGPWQGQ